MSVHVAFFQKFVSMTSSITDSVAGSGRAAVILGPSRTAREKCKKSAHRDKNVIINK